MPPSPRPTSPLRAIHLFHPCGSVFCVQIMRPKKNIRPCLSCNFHVCRRLLRVCHKVGLGVELGRIHIGTHHNPMRHFGRLSNQGRMRFMQSPHRRNESNGLTSLSPSRRRLLHFGGFCHNLHVLRSIQNVDLPSQPLRPKNWGTRIRPQRSPDLQVRANQARQACRSCRPPRQGTPRFWCWRTRLHGRPKSSESLGPRGGPSRKSGLCRQWRPPTTARRGSLHERGVRRHPRSRDRNSSLNWKQGGSIDFAGHPH